jgi:hypothetical protein
MMYVPFVLFQVITRKLLGFKPEGLAYPLPRSIGLGGNGQQNVKAWKADTPKSETVVEHAAPYVCQPFGLFSFLGSVYRWLTPPAEGVPALRV